jgi:hypothetical protein
VGADHGKSGLNIARSIRRTLEASNADGICPTNAQFLKSAAESLRRAIKKDRHLIGTDPL